MRRRPQTEEAEAAAPTPAPAPAAAPTSHDGGKHKKKKHGPGLLGHWRLISVLVGLGVFALAHHYEYWGPPPSLWASVKRALWAGAY